MHDRPNSYIIESLISKSIASTPDSYGDAIKNIFYHIHSTYRSYLTAKSVPTITDPGYASVNVAKRWKFDEFSAFMAEVERSYNIASKALDEEDEDESVKLWQKLFGNKFNKD